MAPPEPPAPPRGASVTSLLDRLQPAQRARHLTTLTLRAQVRDPAHLARLAELAAQLEAFDAADTLAQIERAPRETPEIRRAKMACEASLAAQRYLRGDADGSLSDFAAMIAAHPEEAADAHYFRSFFLELRGEIDAAIADVTRMITLAPLDAGAYARRGEIYHRAGQHGEALANFRRAAQLDPDNLAALSGAGVCLVLARDWEGAIPWLTRAIRIHPKDASLRVERALCFENLERYDEAVADLDIANTLAPDDEESLYARGRCRPESRRTEAIADYTRALEIAPGRADIWMARGRAHLENRALDEALEDFDAALALLERAPLPDAEMAGLHHERADALRGLQRDEDAAAAEARAVEHAPEVALYWSWRGMVRSRVEGLSHLAEADVTRAISLAPSDPVMRFHRALYYEYVERWGDALADLERAIELASEAAAPLHFHRGMTRWLTSDDPGELRKAMADFDRALELEGEDAEALRWRAVGHAHFGDHRAALADLDRALAVEPGSGEAYHLRFESRSALGDAKGAREDLERAAALAYPEAVEELCSRLVAGG